MKQEEWTKRLRNQLADYEEAAPADLWAGIEAKLAEQAAPKQHSRIVPLWGRWAAAAAVFAGVLLGADYLMNETESQQLTVENGAAIIAEVQKIVHEESQNPSESQISEELIPMKSQGMVAQLKQVVSSVEEILTPEPTQEELQLSQIEEQPVGHEKSPVKQEPTEKKSTEKQADSKKSLPSEDGIIRELDRKIAEATRQRRSNVNFGLYASNGFGNQVSSNGVLMNPSMAANYNLDNYRSSGTRAGENDIYRSDLVEEKKHYQPVSFGLTTNIPISPKFSIATGVVYMRQRSDLTKRMNGVDFNEEQTLHYLGIPVGLQYRLLDYRGLKAYVSGGVQVDYNFKVQVKQEYSGGNNSERDRDNLLFSAQGALGLQYNLIPLVGIYVEPGIKYYFDNGSSMRNFFKDQPTVFNLQVGVRLNLGN